MKNIVLLFMFFPLSVLADQSCSNFLKKHNLDIVNIDSSCLWNNERTAIAVCSTEPVTKCFIVDSKNTTNVSRIQQSNLGKLGIAKKTKYESIQTKPKEWLSSKQNQYLVLFQTSAWFNDQRYTVSGPAAVTNGEYRGQ
jgi:hypothetical protein